MKQILTLEELLNYLQAEDTDFFLYLGHGMRSSKSIAFTKEDFSELSIIHEIDDTEEFINLKDWEQSILFTYINKGILYKY